jgi:hypothetical protein
LLLLHNDPSNMGQLSPEEMQKATEKYMAWMKKPFSKDGKRLAPNPSRVLRPQAGKPRVLDGPYSESKEILAGFYLIDAADIEEAVEHTKTNPHLEYGGTIEVRQIFGT